MIIFAPMIAQEQNQIQWGENVIIVDADYVDKVAFDLIVNFERMIGRRIPPADLAKWLVCIALDGGLREGNHQTSVVMIYDKKSGSMENFLPSSYETELNAKAFKDPRLGEFTISCFPVENIVSKEDYLADVTQTIVNAKEVKRVMVIPDSEEGNQYDLLRNALRNIDDDDKRITLFAMQPMPGGNFRQEILGYSLMTALGIKADEIKE